MRASDPKISPKFPRLSLITLTPFHLLYPLRRTVSYNASCINPNDEAGHCVLVQECKLVLSVLRKETLTNDDVAFLYSSECGKLEGKSLVCCPSYSIAGNHSHSQLDPVNRVDQAGQGQGHEVTEQESKPVQDQWSLLPQPGDCGIQPSYQLFGENFTKLDEQPWTALVHYGNKRKNGLAMIYRGSALLGCKALISYSVVTVNLNSSDGGVCFVL